MAFNEISLSHSRVTASRYLYNHNIKIHIRRYTMFRRKDEEGFDTTETKAQTTASSESAGISAGGASARPSSPANTNNVSDAAPSQAAQPVRQASAPVYRPAGAPGARPSVAPVSSATSDVPARKNERVLTVGPDILLKGEIATCDRLLIQGSVDSQLKEVHTVEIDETGSFKGAAKIENAEISGLFEGDLEVRGRLFITATGKVRGSITYGEIEIQSGGELSGTISMGASAGRSKSDEAQKKAA